MPHRADIVYRLAAGVINVEQALAEVIETLTAHASAAGEERVALAALLHSALASDPELRWLSAALQAEHRKETQGAHRRGSREN